MATLRSIDAIVSLVRNVRNVRDVRSSGRHGSHRLIVGIVGSPGAGKSTVGAAVVAGLGPTAQLVAMDGFHLPQATLLELGRRERMGAPDTFDVAGFIELLETLRDLDGEVRAPGFDREVEEAVPGAILIPPEARLIVVEGNYVLHDRDGWERVAPLLDLTLFLEVDRDIRVARLIERHERFGKSGADARAWALGPDEANARLVERTAGLADHAVRLE